MPSEKYTVMLTPRSLRALDQASKMNCETKTSTVNRGIQLYLLMTKLMQDDHEVVVRSPDGQEQRIYLI